LIFSLPAVHQRRPGLLPFARALRLASRTWASAGYRNASLGGKTAVRPPPLLESPGFDHRPRPRIRNLRFEPFHGNSAPSTPGGYRLVVKSSVAEISFRDEEGLRAAIANSSPTSSQNSAAACRAWSLTITPTSRAGA